MPRACAPARPALDAAVCCFHTDRIEPMMTVDQLNEAHQLTQDIKSTRSRRDAFRDAEVVIVALPRSGYPVLQNEIELTNAEIGDAIVAALDRRIEAMTAELRTLGVEL